MATARRVNSAMFSGGLSESVRLNAIAPQDLLQGLHKHFIAAVKAGPGDRLKGEESVLFSGLFWDGKEGIEMGLADAIGSASYVAREVVGAEELVDFTSKEDPLERLADRLGTGVAQSLARLTGLLPGIWLR